MTKLISICAFLTLTSALAQAADSTWMFCKSAVADDYTQNEFAPIVNVYEHRNGDGRQTELTVIYGAHVMVGSFDNSEKDSGPISLKSGAGRSETFKGKAEVDYAKSTLSLKGAYNENVGGDTDHPYNKVLVCEQLN